MFAGCPAKSTVYTFLERGTNRDATKVDVQIGEHGSYRRAQTGDDHLCAEQSHHAGGIDKPGGNGFIHRRHAGQVDHHHRAALCRNTVQQGLLQLFDPCSIEITDQRQDHYLITEGEQRDRKAGECRFLGLEQFLLLLFLHPNAALFLFGLLE